ncbi:MAG: hypothetical protein CMH98_05410 [Oceanospirillaceae bacterium]|nr:hypothetical protein [Oceanospirillaceae bacterium]|tara:strand:- start:229 stop:1431 length:1203 start_codon:yes stop_codon:yes gene_type:complete
MKAINKQTKALAYLAVVSGSLILAGCGGDSSGSSSDSGLRTLVYSGETGDAEVTDENREAIAEQVGEFFYLQMLSQEIGPYTQSISYPDVLEQIEDEQSLYNIPFIRDFMMLGINRFADSVQPAAMLDLETESRDGYPIDETFTASDVGECGGTAEATVIYGEDEFESTGNDASGYQYGGSLNTSTSVTYDDYCEYVYADMRLLAETPAESATYNGSASVEFSRSYNRDNDGEDSYYDETAEGTMEGDFTVTVGEQEYRIRMDGELSYRTVDDERENIDTVSVDSTVNQQIRSGDSLVEFTMSFSGSDDIMPEPQVMITAGGPVYRFNIFDGGVFLPDYGYIYFESSQLTLCEDGSGISSGSIRFGIDRPEGEITFTGCNEWTVSVPDMASAEPASLNKE